jgi:amino acid adenylation domain-containing protein/non-ribosomal peptide synthase protein (TIGR01720 family)
MIEHDAAARFEPFPLTSVQEAYWIGRRSDYALGNVGAHFYAEVDFSVIEGSDETFDRMEAAWQKLIDRHDMLRMIVAGDGCQVVSQDAPRYRIARQNLTRLIKKEAESRLLGIRDELSHQVFDPEVWPLFALRFTRISGVLARLHFSIDLLIADFTSIQVLVSEWRRLVVDPGLELPPLELCFRDYVMAEVVRGNDVRLKLAREFWTQRMANLPLGPELPLAVSHKQIERPRFSRRELTIGDSDRERLVARGQKLGVTPSVVLMTAFAELLSTWASHPDFTLNATFFNRQPSDSRLAGVVGDYTALTLVPARHKPDRTFAAQALSLQRELMQNLDHSEFSALAIMRELARRHRMPQAGMMPVVFTSMLLREQVQQGFGSEWTYVISQTPQVCIDHQVLSRGGELLVSWDTVDELFPHGMLDEMFEAYRMLLAWVTAERTSWTVTPAPLTPRSHLDRITALNATSANLPDERLDQGFWAQVGQNAERPALVFAAQKFSYDGLAARVREVSRELRKRDVQRNQLVALVMERGWEQVVGTLGVLTAGAAFLPIDASTPISRVHQLLAECAVRIVLTQSRLEKRVAWPSNLDVISVDVLGAASHGVAGTTGEPKDLAYVIHTSGSSGLPKGVMIDHLGALNTVRDINARFAINASDRVLAVSPMQFDLSVWDIFGVLSAGGAMVVPEPSHAGDPVHWKQLIREHSVTVWNSVPVLLELLVDLAERTDGEFLRSLRLVLLSGDWIPISLPGRLRVFAPDAKIVSLGGATEASIWSIYFTVNAVEPSWKSIPYGHALTNQRVYVLDASLRVRPIWVPGEIYIGGVGLARGYWNDDEETRKCFTIHPMTGERLYRTGDLGRYHPDGMIELLGREDLQVKIHGCRVEPTEVEAAIQLHPEVRMAAVCAFGDADKRLVAYIVADPQTITPDSVRAFLLERLPNYMIPTSIILLEALPLTENGKVDRASLVEPEKIVKTTDASAEGIDERERVLTAIWKDVLGPGEVLRHERFADLGGDSLGALRVISHAAGRGYRLNPEHFILNPTLAELAAHMAKADTDAGRDVSNGYVQLTPGQEWFFGQDFAEAHHWVGTWPVFALGTRLDPGGLREAFEAVVCLHEGLRQRFCKEADRWQTMITDKQLSAAFDVVACDVDALQADEIAATVERIVLDLNGSLNLTDGPLIRLTCLDLGRDHGMQLVISSHWLILDNYSARVVLDDLRNAYAQIMARDRPVLPPKSASIRQCVERLHEYARSDALANELELWLRLEDAPAVPLDFPGGVNSEASVRRYDAVLDSEATSGLHFGMRRLGVEMKDLLLTALLRTITNWTREQSMIVEYESHGREWLSDGLDVSRTVGRLSVLTPIRLERDRTRTSEEELLHVVAMLRSIPRGGIGYAVLRYLHPDRSVRQELVDTRSASIGLNFWGDLSAYVTPALYPTFAVFGTHHGRNCHRPRAIDVMAAEVRGVLVVQWTYSANLHAGSTIEGLSHQLVCELRSLASVAKPLCRPT